MPKLDVLRAERIPTRMLHITDDHLKEESTTYGSASGFHVSMTLCVNYWQDVIIYATC